MIGGGLAAFVGLLVEYEFGPYVSLIVFLALYFISFFLWVSWVLAVWVTALRGGAGLPDLILPTLDGAKAA
jgi:hypothetical protein